MYNVKAYETRGTAIPTNDSRHECWRGGGVVLDQTPKLKEGKQIRPLALSLEDEMSSTRLRQAYTALVIAYQCLFHQGLHSLIK